MKPLFAIALGLLLPPFAAAQDYRTAFEQHFQDDDTANMRMDLAAWEAHDPKNPELFTSAFNYWFTKARQEVLSMTTEPPLGQSLTMQDSTGETTGYIGSTVTYDPVALKKGLDKIEEGIGLYPDRLDMRFGKIYVLGQAAEWQHFTEEIIRTIQRSTQNGNQWTWTDDQKKENGKEFFLTSLQDYQLDLYNTGNDSLLTNMQAIAEEVLKYYPDHVESLSDLAITYLLTGAYDQGLEVLLKAEQLAPEDPIVLGNIAQGYKLKGDKDAAIQYYDKVIQYGDEDAAAFAKEQIEALKQ